MSRLVIGLARKYAVFFPVDRPSAYFWKNCELHGIFGSTVV